MFSNNKSIGENFDEILSNLKDDQNGGYYNFLLIFLVAIFLLSNVMYFVKFGFSYFLIIGIIVLLFLLVSYRIKIQGAYKKASDISNYEYLKEKNLKEYHTNYAKYLEAGLDIKRIRTVFVKNLYLFIFPLFLFLVASYVYGPFTGKGSMAATLIGAYVFGGLFWNYFFKEDIEAWDYLQDKIADFKNKIHL